MGTFHIKEYAASAKKAINNPLLTKILTNRFYRFLIGAAIGAGAGFVYWEFVGCTGGTCPLTSNPFKTTGLFALLGGFLFMDKNKK